MAERYKNLDARAAKGMVTSPDKTRVIEDSWCRIRSDANALNFAAFVLEGSRYMLSHEGGNTNVLMKSHQRVSQAMVGRLISSME